jgi:hypothetical protein
VTHIPITPVSTARDGSTLVLGKLGDRTVAFVADEADSAIRVIELAGRKDEKLSTIWFALQR